MTSVGYRSRSNRGRYKVPRPPKYIVTIIVSTMSGRTLVFHASNTLFLKSLLIMPQFPAQALSP